MGQLKRINGIGIKKGSTWGTWVKPGTGNGMHIVTHTAPKGGRASQDNSNEYGQKMASATFALNYEAQNGPFTAPLYTGGLETMFASVFGIYTSSTAETTVITHKFALDDGEIDEIFHTIAWDDYGTQITTVPSAKIKSFELASDSNGEMLCTIEYMGNTVSIAQSTGPLALTYAADGTKVHKLLASTVYINAQAGADFSAGDAISVNALKAKIERGYKAMPPESGSSSVQAPVDADAPKGSLELNLTKSTATSSGWLTAFYGETQYKAKIVCDAGAIAGKTAHYLATLYLPCLQIETAPDVSEDTPRPVKCSFKVLKKTAAPTGMSSGLPYLEVVNEVAALTGYPAT